MERNQEKVVVYKQEVTRASGFIKIAKKFFCHLLCYIIS